MSVSYREVLACCKCGAGLLDATVSMGLYGSRSQVEALGLFVDSPDPCIPRLKDQASAWAPLYAYARSLDPSIPPVFSAPFSIALDNRYAEANRVIDFLTGTTVAQGRSMGRGGSEAAAKRAESLARSLYSKLPTALDSSRGILSFYGDNGEEERRSGELTRRVLADKLLSAVLQSEIEEANVTLKVVGESLACLNMELDGARYVSKESRRLFDDIIHDRVPAGWDSVSRSRGSSLIRWLEDLKDRTNFLIFKCDDERLGTSRRSANRPCSNFSLPQPKSKPKTRSLACHQLQSSNHRGHRQSLAHIRSFCSYWLAVCVMWSFSTPDDFDDFVHLAGSKHRRCWCL